MCQGTTEPQPEKVKQARRRRCKIKQAQRCRGTGQMAAGGLTTISKGGDFSALRIRANPETLASVQESNNQTAIMGFQWSKENRGTAIRGLRRRKEKLWRGNWRIAPAKRKIAAQQSGDNAGQKKNLRRGNWVIVPLAADGRAMNGGQDWPGGMAANGQSAIKIEIPRLGQHIVAAIGQAQWQQMATAL
jgi:hypothetical protein